MLLYIEILSNVVLKFPLCRSDGAKSHLCNTEERRAICLCPEIAIRRRKSLHWNRNTMKFHSADCPSVNDMNEENKVAIATREEALALGYAPCKRCNP